MKKLFKFLNLLVVFKLFIFFGCSKKDDNNNTFTDPRDGQVYEYVEIGGQTWMTKNMNYDVGKSWCYDDDPANCITYGRLYDWQTALSACPSGWHLPSDEEWKILEGTLDSLYSVEAPEWDEVGIRGFDVGEKLKTASGWYNSGNGTDLYGFSMLPGGFRDPVGFYIYLGKRGSYWSSTEDYYIKAWYRSLIYNYSGMLRNPAEMGFARSVRCVRD